MLEPRIPKGSDYCQSRAVLSWKRWDAENRLRMLCNCQNAEKFTDRKIKRFSRTSKFTNLPEILRNELEPIL